MSSKTPYRIVLLLFEFLRAFQQIHDFAIVVCSYAFLFGFFAIHELCYGNFQSLAQAFDDSIVRHTLAILPL